MMNSKDLEMIRTRIGEAIESVQKDIESLKVLTRPVSPDNAIGRLTRMEAIQSKSINEAALRAARVKLERLKTARDRTDDPDFGYCDRCDEPIPVKRILLIPETTRCVNCADLSD